MSIFEKESAGLFGVVNETGVTLQTGDFALIQFLATTTFTTLTEANAVGSDALTTPFSFAAGTSIRGRFSAFQLATGAVRAHKVAPQSA